MVVPFPKEKKLRGTRESTVRLALLSLVVFRPSCTWTLALLKRRWLGSAPEGRSGVEAGWAPFLPSFSKTHLDEEAQPPRTFRCGLSSAASTAQVRLVLRLQLSCPGSPSLVSHLRGRESDVRH